MPSVSSVVMEYDLHTVLDALTLAATAWVVYTIRMKLNHTYQAQLDSIYSYYVVDSRMAHFFVASHVRCVLEAAPCLVLAVLVHPATSHVWINRIMWAFCVYLEAVSVLPQLRLMQKNQVGSCFRSSVDVRACAGGGTICGTLCFLFGSLPFLQLCTLDPPSTQHPHVYKRK